MLIDLEQIQIDLYFHYKVVGRFLLIQKLANFISLSLNSIPELTKSFLYFELFNIQYLNDIRMSNYVFLFKFFFGKKAYFAKYKSTFRLNVWYYSFLVLLYFKGKEAYYPIYFFFNDVYPHISKNFLEVELYLSSIIFKILDMTLFLEKKTNIGFFNLKDPLNLRFFHNAKDKQLLFIILKLS
jgi:hypothetical protein